MLRIRTGRKKETKEPEPGTERFRTEALEPSSAKEAARSDTLAKEAVQSGASTQEVPAPMDVDTELVAVIAAAIAAEEEIPVGSFVVRTIKRRA